MKTVRRGILLTALWMGAVVSIAAHPVAQGAIEVRILPETIQVQARVSGEQIFVANTFSVPSDEPKAGTLAEVWQRHGQYLLRHLKVFAGDVRLTGRVVGVAPAQNDFVVYQLEFTGARSPARVRIEEDLLNEIEYAPGNPWEAAFAVRIQQSGRASIEEALLSRQQPVVFACDWNTTAEPAAGSGVAGHLVRQYVRHGVDHILTGYDHLLFVAALVLGAATFWDLVKVVTVFTLAHTVTLALSVLNIVRLPSHVVEPMIAASIVIVAVTNLLSPKLRGGWMRLSAAFFFGLFHGLGFAGGLLSATDGLAGFSIGVAIVAFSVGVELGHQVVVLPLYAGLKLARTARKDPAGREKISLGLLQGGSLLIALAGLFYLVAALR
ncbi:MAG: HupE/UreJ family protein [Opitutaceae bacterium]|nr:HupE/UreJ family protein [Verrucomicrobiales bacterium]